MIILQLLIVLGGAALLACIACLVALHLLPTSYLPVQDPVSNYAVSRYGYLYQIQAFSSGICAACLLAWLVSFLPSSPTVGLIGLAAYALSRMLIIFFPTDVKPPMTWKGAIHVILATTSFTGVAVAVGSLTKTLIGVPGWASATLLLRIAQTLTDACAVGFAAVILIAPFRRVQGLVERGIYLGALTWLGTVFMILLGS